MIRMIDIGIRVPGWPRVEMTSGRGKGSYAAALGRLMNVEAMAASRESSGRPGNTRLDPHPRSGKVAFQLGESYLALDIRATVAGEPATVARALSRSEVAP